MSEPKPKRKPSATTTTKPKLGRPSSYEQKVADIICIRLSGGDSLRKICADAGMPAIQTVYSWMMARPAFLEQYAHAREEQADTLADEIIAIADENPVLNEIRDREGNVVDIKIDSGYVAYQKQRIDARKWTAMKLKPKKYGERLAMEGVEGGAPITTSDISTTRLAEVIKNLELKTRAG